MTNIRKAGTLTEVLAGHKETKDKGVTFISGGNKEEFLSYHELYHTALEALGYLQSLGIQKGDELVFQVDDSKTFIQLFWACILGAVIPVPVSVNYTGENAHKLFEVWKFLDNPYLLISKTHFTKLSESPDGSAFFAGKTVFTEAVKEYGTAGTIADVTAADIAFIQFSSGSTGNPKGVVLTHGNLVHNISGALAYQQCTAADKHLSWMPLTHDMGLIGFHLYPLTAGTQHYIIPTDLFIRHPLLWLQKVSEHRVTITSSPNFGYKYYLNQFSPEKGAGLDLSALRIIYNGAEPISAPLCRRFYETMAPFNLAPEVIRPVYGLAEATLQATAPRPVDLPVTSIQISRDALVIGHKVHVQQEQDAGADCLEVVNVGVPIEGMFLKITDEQGKQLEDGHTGIIWLRGESVTRRYYNNEAATKAVIKKDGWLNTGDTGFTWNGALHVVGRVKDIIFVNGLNIYPHDIEQALETLEGIESGKVVACGIPDPETESETVAVFVVFKQSATQFLPLAASVKRFVAERLGLQVKQVIPVRKIFKTTSGKVKRSFFAEEYRRGAYAELISEMQAANRPAAAIEAGPVTAASEQVTARSEKEIRQWLEHWMQQRFGLSAAELAADLTFAAYGMVSMQAVALAGELEQWLDREIDKVLIYNFSTIKALAAYLAGASGPQQTPAQPAAPASSDKRIAVVGIGCRFPGGINSPDAFWKLLTEQGDGITSIPADRWDIADFFDEDPDAPGKMYTRKGGFIEQVAEFDPLFFGIAPREAAGMDPQQRLLLEVCWEALEHAGIPPAALRGSNSGIFIGMGTDDYQQIVYNNTPDGGADDAFTSLGTERSITAGRIAYALDFHGPVMQLDTACSSSLLSIHQACKSLLQGETTLMLAGGVNLMLLADYTVKLCRMKALSPTDSCKTFDDSADGYVRGEGAGIVVLKRLEDALEANDTILGIINGSAVNHDGLSNGLTAPNGLAQQQLLEKALADAGIPAGSVQYIETHGTGTPLGDPVEVQALNAVYGRGRAADQPLVIGAVKSNIGHLEAAAGIAGLIKTILCLQHGEIPGNLHFSKPNRFIPWDKMTVKVADRLMAWPGTTGKRRAAVSAFGLSGTNVHVLLEEADQVPALAAAVAALPAYPVLLAAKTPQSLQALARKYAALPDTTGALLPDIAYSTAMTRDLFKYRLALRVADWSEAQKAITAFLEDRPDKALIQGMTAPGRGGKLVWLFTGGGAQYWGMGRELYEHNTVFKNIIDHCDAYLQTCWGFSLIHLLYEKDKEEANILLQQMTYFQPAIFAVSCALAGVWKSWGITPAMVLGHSMGEYAAAYTAGVFSLDDGLKLVTARARLMQEIREPGAMATIFAAEETVASLILPFGKDLSIAAVNAPALTVISGKQQAVRAALKAMEAEGIGGRELLIAQASHSPLMEPMLEEFRKVAESIAYHTPTLELVSNLTGAVVTTEVTDADYWCRHILQPVQFLRSIRTVKENGGELLMELGPQPNLLSMVDQIALYEADCLLPCMSIGKSSWDAVLDSLLALYVKGIAINWSAFYTGKGYKKVNLPLYAFNRQTYWVTPGERQKNSIVLRPDAVPAAVPAAAAMEAPAALPVLDRKESIITFLAGALGRLLKMAPGDIDVHADFLLLGANSLMMSSMVKAVEQEYGLKLTIKQLFDTVITLDELAAYIETQLPAEALAAPKLAKDAAATSVMGLMDQTQIGDQISTLIRNEFQVIRQQLADTLEQQFRQLTQQLRKDTEPAWHTGNGHTAYNGNSNGKHYAHGASGLQNGQDIATTELVAEMPPTEDKDGLAVPVRIPLSFNQESLWLLDQIGGSIAYHEYAGFWLEGKLDKPAMETALHTIIDRHEVLRTVIREEEGRAYQQVMDAGSWTMTVIGNVPYAADQPGLEQYITDLVQAPFDLANDMMLRVHLLRFAQEKHLLLLTIHHIAFDGWSAGITFRELVSLYGAFSTGKAMQLPELAMQYIDYTLAQRSYLEYTVLEQKLAYWKERLAGIEPLNLPADYSRPAVQSTRGARHYFQLDQELTSQLQQLSRQHGATLFMTLLSAFKVLLYRHSGQGDIAIGTSVAGRAREAEEALIGFFVNTLVLRNDLGDNPAFSTLLARIRQTTLEAYDHQDAPFEKVVEAVVRERDMSRTPLFQVMFELFNTPDAPVLSFGDMQLSAAAITHTTALFDLIFAMKENENGLGGYIEYCTDLFHADTISRMAGHFVQLLQAVVLTPEMPVALLPMLTSSEETLLHSFSGYALAYPSDQTFVSLFATRVAADPGSIALVQGREQLSYTELDSRANQLSHYLRGRGVQADSLVGICTERGFAMVIAILGVWKAGGAYIPIDPAYPGDRVAFILEDSGAQLVLSTTVASTHLGSVSGLVLLDDEAIDREPVTAPDTAPDPADLSYIIYTSGSTGKPKGAMIEHRGMLNHLYAKVNDLHMHPGSVVAYTASYTFDISVWQMFSALLCGGTTVIYTEDQVLQPAQLMEAVDRQQVSILELVPSYLAAVLQENISVALRQLQYLLVTGEAVSRHVLAGWFSHGQYKRIPVVNAYGPTEASDDITHHIMYDVPAGHSVPVGKPVQNMYIYIVDAAMQLCPVGVTGEICVAGIGVGRGYINRAELTAKQFIHDPFGPDQAVRMYRTGDLGHWLPDGTVAYTGRIDDQVKIRGYRIELGEIESVLQHSGLVQQAVVLAKTDPAGNKRLVGYIVPEANSSQEAIINHLKEQLPEYMVPGVWVSLTHIPLTANGKIDRKGLPEPDMSLAGAGTYIAPVSDTEHTLAGIWQDLLGLVQVGIHDNFFTLGGDSIIAIQVVSRCKRLGYDLQPKDIFLHQTIAELAAIADSRKDGGQTGTGEQGLLEGEAPLLPIQQWFFEQEPQQQAAIHHYNQSVLFTLDKHIGKDQLQQVVHRLQQQHDALRFSYHKTGEGWQQRYGDGYSAIIEEDFSAITPADLEAKITACCSYYQGSLDIEQQEVLRMVWMRLPDQSQTNRLLIAAHHLVIDGVSWRILLEDIGQLLEGSSQLTAKTSSYRQWHEQLSLYGQSKRLLDQRRYWQQARQAGYQLPVDHKEATTAFVADSKTYTQHLDTALTRQLLQDVSGAYLTEINDLLLAGLTASLTKWSGQRGVVIGLEGHGREDIGGSIDTSRTVGWFTSLYPVLLELPEAAHTGDLVKSIKEQLRNIPDKGLGYGVLKYISKEPGLQQSDPWTIVFNYLGQLDNATGGSQWLGMAAEHAGPSEGQQYPLRDLISVTGRVQDGALYFDWVYSGKHYEPATIETLAAAYIGELTTLISHCVAQVIPSRTPSDYGLTGVSYQKLDQFLNENNNNNVNSKITSLYRLSGLQEGMLFHGLYDQEVVAYIEQFTCNLYELDIAVFEQAWQYILDRHSILRSSFSYEALDLPVQCVHEQVNLPFTLIDYRHLDTAAQALEEQQYLDQDRMQGFDFSRPPLMRITLLQTGDEAYRMVWTYHHLLMDGWSLPVLLEELLQNYELLLAGKALPERAVDHYEDYIRYISRRDREGEEQYWRSYMKGLESASYLPFVNTARDRSKGIGTYKEHYLSLDAGVTAQINSYARLQGLTVNTIMQGVWAFILHAYTGNQQVSYGILVSGRPAALADVEQRVGMYINTIPLHTGIDREQDIVTWLSAIQQDQIRSREYEHTALSAIQKWTPVTGELFDSTLVFQNYPISEVARSGNWKLKVDNIYLKERSNYPLNIMITVSDTISVMFGYNASVLEDGYIHNLSGHFEQVLRQFIGGQQQKLGAVKLLTSSEETLLHNFSGYALAYPSDQTFVSLFATRVAADPGSIALVQGRDQLSYAELDSRANQLAHYLRGRGVQADSLVGICTERGFAMVIAILGVWKAGGAYIPIDPAYPGDRVAFILEDSGAQLVLSTTVASTHLGSVSGLVLLDDEAIGREPVTAPATAPDPADLSYIIYTSGSTGKPKGAMIEHRGMLNHLYAKVNDLHMHPGSVVAYTASYTFDISVWQMFSALLCGGTTVIYTEDQVLQPAQLMEAVDRQQVSILELVPSYLAAVLQENISVALRQLQYLLVTGEAVSRHVLAGWFSHGQYKRIPVVNAYGPTEASDDITHHIMYDVPAGHSVPVGKPVQNMYIYIVDAAMQLCPVGVTGEICVAGIGVGRGYINRAELTAKQFIHDPFGPDQAVRMYRTGDLGHWLPDGTVAYTGRIDDQVKIRGYRIELGEIESVLQHSGLVQQAVVLAKTDPAGNKRLVGYIVPEANSSQEAIINHLKEQLPEYMVPGVWVSLTHIPLTANGKIDRKGLPEPDMSLAGAGTYIAPVSDTEHTLAGIWQDLLGLVQVGIHDNFFTLGGDSIIAIQVVSRCKRLGYDLQPKDIFLHQTIAELAAIADSRKDGGQTGTGEQGLLEGEAPLLPIQQWFFEQEPQQQAAIHHYNQSVLFTLDKHIGKDQLQQVVHRLQQQHDALRFSYHKTGEGWQQRYGDGYSAIIEEDFSAITPADLEAKITACCSYYQGSLDIEQQEVLRMVWMRLPDQSQTNRLLIAAHHLVIDGVSWRILLEDIGQLLEGSSQLTAKTSSYRQWHEQLSLYGQSKRLLDQRRYWQQARQAGYQLPVDHKEATTAFVADSKTYTQHLDTALTRQLLQDVSGAYLTEINDLLLAGLTASLTKWSGQRGVVIGLEGHGREDIGGSIDTSRTVGWFTSLYPVLLELPEAAHTGDLVKSIKEQLRNIPDKGLGYGVLKYISKEPGLQQSDPWTIVFNYLGQLDNATGGSQWLGMAAEHAGPSEGQQYPLRDLISVTGRVQDGALYFDWVYSGKHYEPATIETLAAAYIGELTTLISHCVAQVIPSRTPSDYGLTGVSYQKLDQFLNENNNNNVNSKITSLYRLSGLQEGMLFHGLYDQEVVAYIEQFTCNLYELDIAVFEQAWQYILDRHSILRSSFSYEALDLPVQCVHEQVNLPFTLIDYRHLDTAAQALEEQQYLDQDRMQGFDFSRPPLMRITLLQTGDEAYRMVWTYHHLLMDGWSLPVLLEELLQNYELLLAGKTVPERAVDHYEDYIRYISRRDREGEEQYWRSYMKGLESASYLPFVNTARDRSKGIGTYKEHYLSLDAGVTAQINSYARLQGLTVNTIMQGVWAFILHAYTGNQQVVYGVTVSGRPAALPDVEQRVGMYINTIPLHTGIDREQNIVTWLSAIQQDQIRSREYEHTALSAIQKWTPVTGELFDSILVYENYPLNDAAIAGDRALKIENLHLHEHTNYPLNIIITANDTIRVMFGYNASVLEDGYVHNLSGHFEQVLRQIVSGAESRLGGLSLLTVAEQKILFTDFKGAGAGWPRDTTVVARFREQVAQSRDAVAIRYADVVLSYTDLDLRSEQLAAYLRTAGVKAGALVPVCLERSADMIVAIFGILKAGAAYVPLDPAYPAERISYILEDTGATLVVSNSACAVILPQQEGRAVLLLDADQAQITGCPVVDDPQQIEPGQLAYIIYTSGSTGKPKGVMIEHRSLMSYLCNDKTHYVDDASDTTGSFAHLSYTFDASLSAMFMPLLAGKTLVIGAADALSAFEEPTFINNAPYDFIKLTPAHLPLLALAIEKNGGTPFTHKLVVGGEALEPAHLRYWTDHKLDVEIVNEYGPTEATVGCTTFTFNTCNYPADRYASISIGKPIDNVDLFIVDDNRNAVPVGVFGEICIAGDGLARGYLGRPDLSAEKFIDVTFPGLSSKRIYRTGDIGRWLPDGTIEYGGRTDDQVKINGFRIETGEIEHVLQQAEEIEQAVVLATTGQDGARRLVAYVVAGQHFSKATVQTWLAARLPAYMIPALWIQLDAIPLTANGKVDRRALPEAAFDELPQQDYVAPVTAEAQLLAGIWEQLLGLEKAGLHDDFFAAGGHSLLAIRLLAQIRQAGYNLALSDLVVHSTLEAQALLLEQHTGITQQALRNWSESGHILPLNPVQEGQPLFILPGGVGIVDVYTELGQAIGDAAPVYGLNMTGLLEGELPLDTIPEIAAQNISWIKAIQPHGPYRLAGHSFGAYVLHEMIRQLEAGQDEVQFAAILDAPAQQNTFHMNADALLDEVLPYLLMYKLVESPEPHWLPGLKSKMEVLPAEQMPDFMIGFIREQCLQDDRLGAFLVRVFRLMIRNATMDFGLSGMVKAPLTIFRAADQVHSDGDATMGWTSYATVLKTLDTPGDHESMVKGKHARTLALLIRECLEPASRDKTNTE
ncbi:hybrid non-ribosomal peptide synthetase/type I polyketide synthase [Taibaiella chishuiensis]|uniref:Non-ribosomal peptide synthase protein (TIGR01720 family)/amino acid adenylation domain-containing protein n=1 Tax=Taibaiella chishuiensis TaxID=1434707 RepID=A0A2P8CXA2_9BACT|nr:hybrid non-ribosomal peptide synthetase/type I polyketide synthase [Taibaiella chishuiensis]PSK89557.1 non-ribosomal peptide synthase protein (TIGR01720 family)/amino acid adenylation domain-containing protein [Taibaiella chishuiensis]